MPIDNTRDRNFQDDVERGNPKPNAYLVTPAAAELPVYADALRVYVPDGTANAQIVVVLLGQVNDATTLTLKYAGGGVYYEALNVRRVVSATAGIEVHALHAW